MSNWRIGARKSFWLPILKVSQIRFFFLLVSILFINRVFLNYLSTLISKLIECQAIICGQSFSFNLLSRSENNVRDTLSDSIHKWLYNIILDCLVYISSREVDRFQTSGPLPRPRRPPGLNLLYIPHTTKPQHSTK